MDTQSIESKSWNYLFLSWLVATIATLGSLFFSEIAQFPPCSLCWYQRICMYPLVIILLIGQNQMDKKVFNYAIPFTITGLAISIYHNLLQLEIIPDTMSPCLEGIPCSGIYIQWFGFITIPVLSLVAFSIITTILFIFKKKEA